MIDKNYYMSEGCGIFAYVLQRIMGGEIYILSRKNGDKWSRSIPWEVTHVIVQIGGVPFDVKGARSLQQIAEDFDETVETMILRGPFTPTVFKKQFLGNADRYPLFAGGATEQKECAQYIENDFK